RGAVLYGEDGREYLDLISSWWTCTHGHGHPALVRAIAAQAAQLDHVMFGGFTHPAAAALAGRLAALLPGGLERVFFSDNGSTAVEVALKMAYHYWRNRGDTARTRFLAFDGGYHGDTLGAMSVGRGCGYFTLYADIMCEVETVPFADTWEGDGEVEAREARALAALDRALEAGAAATAALIVEPLMQGAAGMRVCRPQFLRAVTERARAADILVIHDEVATGFGRTGTLFACEQAGVAPDIVCLAKGLTAGMLPMSVTVTRQDIFEAFRAPDFARALAHGHSFTANPTTCALALASLDLYGTEKTMDRIGAIARAHRAFLPELAAHPRVTRPRALGTMLAFDLKDDASGYKSAASVALRDRYLEMGLNIRPLGPSVYLLPPYCLTPEQLGRAHAGLIMGLDGLEG
ncbi:MAG: adenosylmethionine--8-amino-7-oxononanoate transaminase, partial [Hyphomicrobiales bacterium]